ncbi:MAG TPA: hypothetical protein VGE07_04770 [Herpetosiphonaceae bacterium]
MSGLSFLLTWYNLPFMIILGCSFALVLLNVLGGGDDSDSDADADADADGVHADVLSFIGVGQVPLTLVLTAFLSSLGVIGLLLNTVGAGLLGSYPGWLFGVTFVGGLVLAVLATSRISRALGRLAPESTTAISFEQLVGRVGKVDTPTVSATYGRVRVKDSHGALHTVFAVTGGGEPIPEHSEVALISYDPRSRCFTVKPM